MVRHEAPVREAVSAVSGTQARADPCGQGGEGVKTFFWRGERHVVRRMV